MGSKLTGTGVTFGSNTTEQTKPVVSVNSSQPNASGEITIDIGATSSELTTVQDRITKLELREDKDILMYPYYGWFDESNITIYDIRTGGTTRWANAATTWQDIHDGITAAYPPSLYDVGKRLLFKPHVYYNFQIHAHSYFVEYVWLLTVRPAGYSYFTYNADGSTVQPGSAPLVSTTKFWHVEYNGLPRQRQGNIEIDWTTYDGS